MNVNENILYKRIGSKLRQGREAFGITQDTVASAIGLTRTSVTNAESGVQRISLHTIYMWCGLLGLDIHDVLPTMSEIVSGDTLAVVDNRIEELQKQIDMLKQLRNGTP